MVVFARVVEEGSFSGAARALGYSRAAVSKQIAGLERQVGAQLLNRTTRKMSLTEIGSEFYARCARIAHEVEEAERVVAAMRGKPAGLLRIACPMDFGRTHLASVVPQFLAKFPEVRVQLAMSDQQADLVNDRCDLAIRVTPSFDEASFIARRLAMVHQIVCAAPGYLTSRGTPQSVKDLSHHACLVYTNTRTPEVWRFASDLSVRVSGPLSANNGAVLCRAALDGIGLVQLPAFLVRDELANGSLVRILREFEPDPLGVFALYPRNRMLAPKVAAFIDFLASQDLDGAPDAG